MPASAAGANRSPGLAWGGLALAAVALSPLAEWLAGGLPRCTFKAFTGQPCPACGTTRAALALARLDLAEALAVNPLAAVAWAFFVAGGLVAGALALAGRPLPAVSSRWPRRLLAAGLGLIVLNWIYLIAHGT